MGIVDNVVSAASTVPVEDLNGTLSLFDVASIDTTRWPRCDTGTLCPGKISDNDWQKVQALYPDQSSNRADFSGRCEAPSLARTCSHDQAKGLNDHVAINS